MFPLPGSELVPPVGLFVCRAGLLHDCPTREPLPVSPSHEFITVPSVPSGDRRQVLKLLTLMGEVNMTDYD